MSDVPNLNTEVLIEIRESIREMDKRLSGRMDNMIDTMGALWREHEQWLRDHDVKIGQLEKDGRRRPGPPRLT